MKPTEKTQEEKRNLIDAQSVFTKLKRKKISPASKKEIARRSLTQIVRSKQLNFNTFKNNYNNKHLGIRKKKPFKNNIDKTRSNSSSEKMILENSEDNCSNMQKQNGASSSSQKDNNNDKLKLSLSLVSYDSSHSESE